MKMISIVFGSITALLVGVYVFIFTSAGHGVILPIIEGQIKQATNLQNIKITQFDLSPSHLDTIVMVEDQKISANADFGLMAKTIDLNYDVQIKDLSKFDKLTQMKLNGEFSTKGNIKGVFDNLDIKGIAALAKGDISYDLNIAGENINDIDFNIVGLDLQKLLVVIGQPKYIQGSLNTKGKISSQNLESVIFDAKVDKGKFNTAVFKESLNIVIPKSDFTLTSNANLKNKKGDIALDFNSLIAKINSGGDVDLNNLSVDSKYNIAIDNLGILEPIIATKLNGSFSTNGTVKGDQNSMVIDGKSNVALSKTTYQVNLKDMKPGLIKANISGAKLDQLLYIVNQPKYAKADLNVDATINSLENLNGKITTTLKKGLLNKKVVKKEFDIALPKNATFDGTVHTKLNSNMVISDVVLNSFAAILKTKKTAFNIEKTTLNTDYALNIPSLSKFYFLTGQKMKGALNVNGDVGFDEKLTATFDSKKFGGTINGKLDDNKLNVKINKVKTLPLLDMMYYPQIFKSNLNLNLDYDLTTKKGLSKIDMDNGKFLTNEAMTMIKQLTSYDLTLEVYKTANITTKIDNQNLYNDLFMESKNSQIKSKKLDMNLEKKRIDGDLDVKYRKYNLGVKLSGNIASPKVKVDPGDAIKTKAKEEIKKKLSDKLDKDLGGLLKNLF